MCLFFTFKIEKALSVVADEVCHRMALIFYMLWTNRVASHAFHYNELRT